MHRYHSHSRGSINNCDASEKEISEYKSLDKGTIKIGISTTLTRRYLLKYIKKEEAPKVLDVGCGSGILSIVALKLGAREVVGTDLDPCAITATEENTEVNGIPKEKFDVMINKYID